jgi:hypothetical protein
VARSGDTLVDWVVADDDFGMPFVFDAAGSYVEVIHGNRHADLITGTDGNEIISATAATTRSAASAATTSCTAATATTSSSAAAATTGSRLDPEDRPVSVEVLLP